VKVILLSDVKSVGKKGEVVDVSDGYGQNFLIPKRLASPATEGAVKRRKKELADQSSKKARELEAAQDIAKKLESKPLIIKVKVGDGGKLFGSVTSSDIAKMVKDEFGESVDKKKIHLPKPIRELGDHKVKARLYKGVQAELTVSVQSEEE
jgi:large subunit ribosomal protein L9